MPANTPKGYPYPLGTDRLMDGDDSIHSLATAVDTKLGVMASGVATINITVLNTVTPVAVTFPAGLFTVAPVMAVSSQTTNGLVSAATASAPTTTGVTINGVRSSSVGTVTANWIAVQQ